MKRILAAIAILILATFLVFSASAQAPPGPQDQQPPSVDPSAAPGVARVSFIRGDVSMQRGDSGDTSAATLNTPLVAGDKISTGDGSRTELQLDYANVLRLDERAEANIATLTQNRIQVQLSQGLASFSVLRGSQADVEIDTPNVAVHPTKEGRYRIQVDPSGNTFVTVREGQAEVSTQQGSTTVNKGELITIQGTGADAAYQTSRASSNDDWDDWSRDRDNVIQNAEGVRRTNPYYTGAGDLDTYGTWSEVPDYGPVWVPRVAVGWAPYRDGRWVWEPFYGWTWVSYESWGWAPYHYGRWFLYGTSWAWWPGPVYRPYRPIWAPAYVSFFGFGGGIGVGFGFGGGFASIGWLPIGPADYFHPWYGGYRFGVVGVTGLYGLREGFSPLHAGGGFSNLRDVAFNDRLRAGVSTVAANRFGRGAVQARAVSAEEFRSGRALTGSIPVTPTRESMRASDRAARPGAFSARSNSDHFFSRNAPANRSFNEQNARSQGNFQAGRSATAPGGGSYRPPSTSYREPLNLNRPIVNDRAYSAPSSRGQGYGGYRAAPRVPESGYRGAAPAPTYRSAPSYRSAPAPSNRAGASRGSSASRSSGRSRSSGGGRHR